MVSVSYNNIGKGIAIDGVTWQVFYGADFNPDSSGFSGTPTVTDATTNFDLSNFQPGHEVGCGVFRLSDGSYYENRLYADFERYDDTWHVSWSIYFDVYISGGWWGGYVYFGVDWDEIWAGYSKYRIHYYTMDGTIDFYSPEFTTTNLSIDSTKHRAGDIWVEGSHICYIDGTWSGTPSNKRGFKHKIAFDSSYSTNVGSDNAGYIRLDDTDLLRIYYVDEFGNRRRTYPSRERYGGNVNVGSSNKGYMRVSSSGDAEEGYAHLCFIAPNGSKRRILNGPVAGYS